MKLNSGNKTNAVIRKAQVQLLTTGRLFQAILGEGFSPSRTFWPAVTGGDEPRPYEILSNRPSGRNGAPTTPLSFTSPPINCGGIFDKRGGELQMPRGGAWGGSL